MEAPIPTNTSVERQLSTATQGGRHSEPPTPDAWVGAIAGAIGVGGAAAIDSWVTTGEVDLAAVAIGVAIGGASGYISPWSGFNVNGSVVRTAIRQIGYRIPMFIGGQYANQAATGKGKCPDGSFNHRKAFAYGLGNAMVMGSTSSKVAAQRISPGARTIAGGLDAEAEMMITLEPIKTVSKSPWAQFFGGNIPLPDGTRVTMDNVGKVIEKGLWTSPTVFINNWYARTNQPRASDLFDLDDCTCK